MTAKLQPTRRQVVIGASSAIFAGLLPRALGASAKGSDDKPADAKSHEAFFGVMSDYRGYYAGYEPLCFTALKPEPAGLRLGFDSNQPGFRHVEIAMEDDSFRVLAGGSILVPFDLNADMSQDKVFRVRPIGGAGDNAPTYTLRINWMTRRAFTKAGGFRKKDVVRVECDPPLSFGTNRPDQWRTFKPTAADTAFARKQWGHLLEGVTSDYAKAQVLTKALMRELREHGGLPSAFLYELPTFEKYLAITSGKSKHACAQYSEIFSMACNVFGVINRWGFINDGLDTETVHLALGNSHLVAEIFDRELNQWVFIDGRYSTLGAYLGNVGPLTLHEFFLFLNQPNRRKHLDIVHYDPVTDREQRMRAEDNPKPFDSYLGWNKGYHTAYRGAAAVDADLVVR